MNKAPKNILKLIVSLVVCELVGTLGAAVTGGAIQSGWYDSLVKSSLNPPAQVFGPVWASLYALMGVSLFLVWRNNWQVKHQLLGGRRHAWNYISERFWTGTWQTGNIIAIFAIQLWLNVLWSFIFFDFKMPGLAFFEILALWASIVYTIINFYRVSRVASYILWPYLLWVTFAVYLNFVIWMSN